MPARRPSESGQLLVPMAGVLVVFGLLCAGYVKWCRALYWRMRMEMVADATALSAARAEAEMLNRIADKNLMMNRYVTEVQVPEVGYHFGTISAQDYPKFRNEAKELRNKVDGFRTYSAGAGRIVAKANGADLLSPYFPYPMDSCLQPETVHLLIRMPPPVYALYQSVEGAFYVRLWKPSVVKAQPSHRTTWIVKKNGFRGMATARVWLDVPTASLAHNGGFPRKQESILRGIGIQSLMPQFTARLAPNLKLTPDDLLRLWQGKGHASDEG